MLEELKKLLNVSSDNEELLEFVINAVIQKVLNYINHETLPKELEYDVKLIVIACYQDIISSIKNESEDMNLTKVKRGDTEYDYEIVKRTVYNLMDSEDFFGYKVSLNTFRKLRW